MSAPTEPVMLYVDSRDRISGTNSDYQIDIGNEVTLKGLKRMKLVEADVTQLPYNVTANNSFVYFSETLFLADQEMLDDPDLMHKAFDPLDSHTPEVGRILSPPISLYFRVQVPRGLYTNTELTQALTNASVFAECVNFPAQHPRNTYTFTVNTNAIGEAICGVQAKLTDPDYFFFGTAQDVITKTSGVLLFEVQAIEVVSPGYGFTDTPFVVIEGDTDGAPATATANLVDGRVATITITDPGSGYRRPPKVFVYGGGGDGVELRPVMNFLARDTLADCVEYHIHASVLDHDDVTIAQVPIEESVLDQSPNTGKTNWTFAGQNAQHAQVLLVTSDVTRFRNAPIARGAIVSLLGKDWICIRSASHTDVITAGSAGGNGNVGPGQFVLIPADYSRLDADNPYTAQTNLRVRPLSAHAQSLWGNLGFDRDILDDIMAISRASATFGAPGADETQSTLTLGIQTSNPHIVQPGETVEVVIYPPPQLKETIGFPENEDFKMNAQAEFVDEFTLDVAITESSEARRLPMPAFNGNAFISTQIKAQVRNAYRTDRFGNTLTKATHNMSPGFPAFYSPQFSSSSYISLERVQAILVQVFIDDRRLPFAAQRFLTSTANGTQDVMGLVKVEDFETLGDRAVTHPSNVRRLRIALVDRFGRPHDMGANEHRLIFECQCDTI